MVADNTRPKMLNQNIILCFLLALICSIAVIFVGVSRISPLSKTTTTDVTGLRGENRWFCLTIKPNVDMVVVSSELVWGKWVRDSSDFREIDGPNGKHASPTQPLTICSSGRQMSPSGTEGYAWLATTDDKQIKVYWSSPAIGAVDFYVDHDSKEFEVTTEMTSSQSVNHIVRKI